MGASDATSTTGPRPCDSWSGGGRPARRSSSTPNGSDGVAATRTLPGPSHPRVDQPGLLWYFGGLFTGEGSFQLTPRTARAIVKLRRDDRPLLLALAEIVGLGRVYDLAACGTANPSSSWMVLSQPELPEICEVLAEARLRGRKLREFNVWRAGVDEFTRARLEGRPRDRQLIELATEGLRNVRRYVHRPFTPTSDGADAQQAVFLELMRTWAAATEGELTCTKYMVTRKANPHWPNRDTIVRAFGSWTAALDAAGLAGRASPRARARQRACSASIPTTAARMSRRSRLR